MTAGAMLASPRDTARGAVLVLSLVLIAAFFAVVGHVRTVTEGPDYQALLSLRPWIKRYVRRRCGAMSARDLTAEVLLRAIVSWGAYRPDESDPHALRRWIGGIARNTVLEQRRNARTAHRARRAYQRERASDPRAEAGGEVEARSLLSLLRDSTSPDNWRIALLQGEGYTAEEIAALEGKPASRIEWRLRQARRDFARVLGMIERKRGKR